MATLGTSDCEVSIELLSRAGFWCKTNLARACCGFVGKWETERIQESSDQAHAEKDSTHYGSTMSSSSSSSSQGYSDSSMASDDHDSKTQARRLASTTIPKDALPDPPSRAMPKHGDTEEQDEDNDETTESELGLRSTDQAANDTTASSAQYRLESGEVVTAKNTVQSFSMALVEPSPPPPPPLHNMVSTRLGHENNHKATMPPTDAAVVAVTVSDAADAATTTPVHSRHNVEHEPSIIQAQLWSSALSTSTATEPMVIPQALDNAPEPTPGVVTPGDHHSNPATTPEEERKNEGSSPRRQLSGLLYCALILLTVIAVAIVTVAVIAGVCGFNGCSSSSTSTGTARNEAMLAFIRNITHTNTVIRYVASSSLLDAPLSAEERAVQWLIEQDPLRLVPDTAESQFRIAQRYALLTLSFTSDQ
jgi:hypothetical protein